MSKEKGKEGKKGKVPNANEINPMLMDQLGQVTPENFIQFMMGNPEIVPETFRKAYWKNIKGFGTLMGLSAVGGTAFNMVVTRAYPRFLILSNWSRIPLRFAIFAMPFVACYPKLNYLYTTGNDMVEDQFIKIQRFRRTGNI